MSCSSSWPSVVQARTWRSNCSSSSPSTFQNHRGPYIPCQLPRRDWFRAQKGDRDGAWVGVGFPPCGYDDSGHRYGEELHIHLCLINMVSARRLSRHRLHSTKHQAKPTVVRAAIASAYSQRSSSFIVSPLLRLLRPSPYLFHGARKALVKCFFLRDNLLVAMCVPVANIANYPDGAAVSLPLTSFQSQATVKRLPQASLYVSVVVFWASGSVSPLLSAWTRVPQGKARKVSWLAHGGICTRFWLCLRKRLSMRLWHQSPWPAGHHVTTPWISVISPLRLGTLALRRVTCSSELAPTLTGCRSAPKQAMKMCWRHDVHVHRCWWSRSVAHVTAQSTRWDVIHH
ncbi:hypothetical protein CONLIGDRAFT_141927 [Coniochaeta ligniaria NRRL 30616]|uniref:Uncharacterized protein n=1 Tax=Coniochaeta ligniaria NRRL 30616 TaxID=1408157 RepID=A0A1J7I7B2_9PEZI|nr:hypothetical protein CONLIGDRAFT_141927 [Coniochaeta ligniaria NRRL 30616]